MQGLRWAGRVASLVALGVACTLFLLLANARSLRPSTTGTPCCSGHYAIDDGKLLGCPYPSGDVWQRSVAFAPLDPRSSAWLAAVMAGGGDRGFEASIPTNELINVANDSTPLVPVKPKVAWHKPYSPIPWEARFYIEPLSDHHSLVLQAKSCQYYEGYETTYSSDGFLSMYSNLHVDLTRAFVRPAKGASTATAIPIGLIAIRPEELAAGNIHHALGWDAVAGALSQTDCVSPAAITDCTDGVPYKGPQGDVPMPYGAHARLKASFDISGFSREAKIVAQAMKTYGLFVYDTGCCSNEVVLVDDRYGAPAWTDDDARDLRRISPQDFEIVPPPSAP